MPKVAGRKHDIKVLTQHDLNRINKTPQLVSDWLFNVPRSIAYEILPHLNPAYYYEIGPAHVMWRDGADPAVELVRLKKLGVVGIYWRRPAVPERERGNGDAWEGADKRKRRKKP